MCLSSHLSNTQYEVVNKIQGVKTTFDNSREMLHTPHTYVQQTQSVLVFCQSCLLHQPRPILLKLKLDPKIEIVHDQAHKQSSVILGYRSISGT